MEVRHKSKGTLIKKHAMSEARAYMVARKAMHENAALLVPPADGEMIWKVTSFTTKGIFYELETEGGTGVKGKFVSCSCPAFSQSGQLCKHIALGIIILPGTGFQPAEAWQVKEECLLEQTIGGDGGVEEGVGQEAEEQVDIKLISPLHLINHYIDGIITLRAQMEPNFTNEDEVINSLKRAYELCSDHFTPRSEYSLAKAHQRQCNKY